MKPLTLQHPIHTLDGRLLFSKGTLLTKETLDVFAHSYTVYSYRAHPLVSRNSFVKDWISLLKMQPYVNFFPKREQLNALLSLLEKVRAPLPIGLTMNYFKRYDFQTYAHILMVFALSALLARDLLPDHQDYIESSASGFTHDIGKICVPLDILQKRTPLTKVERDSVEHHAVAGYILLCYYYKKPEHPACRVALEHHERRDGAGYPQGIILQDPMVEIIAVSDVYDALIRPRPYRSAAFDNRAALEQIIEMARQNKLGWDVVKALIAHNRKSKPNYKELVIGTEKRGKPPSQNRYGMIAEEDEPV